MVYKYFDKKTSYTNKGTKTNSENKELTEELQKPVIRKFKKLKVYSSLIDNILGTDLVDMQRLSNFNEGIHFLLRVLMFIVNIIGLFFWKIKNALQLLMIFRKKKKNSN